MAVYVIKSWAAQNKPIDQQQNYVHIHGRKQGLLSLLMALVGIDPTVTLRIGARRLEFEESSLAGTEKRLVPLEGLCSSYYAYARPLGKSFGFLFVFFMLGVTLFQALGATNTLVRVLLL